MVREQRVLRGGSPLSVAVTIKVYSARSEWRSGDDENSSPVFGFRENRSALGPKRNADGMSVQKHSGEERVDLCF